MSGSRAVSSLRGFSVKVVVGMLAATTSLIAQTSGAASSGEHRTLITQQTNAAAIARDSSGNLFVAVGDNVTEYTAVSNYTSTVPVGSGFSFAAGIAVDAAGNVYVSDNGHNLVKKVLAAGGYTTVNTVATIAEPANIALDSSGNVFVYDFDNSYVRRISAANGNVTTIGIYTPSLTGLAVDAGGNVYYGDISAGAVTMLLNDGSNYTNSVSVGPGFTRPWGLAVDSRGTVYVTDTSNGYVWKNVVDTVNGGYISTPIAKFGTPNAIVADNAANVYVLDDSQVVEMVGITTFAAEPVGTASPVTTSLNFMLNQDGGINPPRVVTLGAASKDFVDAGTGSCTTNGINLNNGDTCTVDVTFTPSAPGLREGAVQILLPDGTEVATQFVEGTGTGPRANFTSPTVVDHLPSSYFYSTQGVAVDGNGYAYATLRGSTQIDKISPSGSITGINSGIQGTSLGIDGAGNLYVLSPGDKTLYELLASNAYTGVVTRISYANTPNAMTVDGEGNVFSSTSANDIEEDSPTGVLTRTLYTNATMGTVAQITVGGNGDLYWTVPSQGAVYTATKASGYTSVTKLLTNITNVTGIAVDANGTIFYSDGATKVYQYSAADGVTRLMTQLGLTINGLALDGTGTLFFSDYANGGGISRVNRTSGTLALGTGAAPQTMAIHNDGNQALTFAIPATGNNPSLSANFSMSNSTTCPQLTPTSGSAGTLAAGASCNYVVALDPHTPGTYNGSLIMNDNSLNVVGATQTAALTGASPLGISITAVSVPVGTASANLSASVSYSLASAPTGAFTFQVDSGATVTASCTGSSSPLTCTASYATSGLSVGTHTITAVSASDTNYPTITDTANMFVTATTLTLSVAATMVKNTATSATLNATIAYPGSTAPTGAFTFQVDAGATVTATCSSAVYPVQCTANYAVSGLSVGNHTITGRMAADGNYGAASATNTLTVVAPALTVTAAAASVSAGTVNVTLSATVAYNWSDAPTGSVTFQVAGSTVGSTCTGANSPLTCTVSFATGSLAVGSYTITAAVAGDANYASASGTNTLTITKPVPKIKVSATSMAYGASTLNVSASIAYTGATQPSGAITFQIDSGTPIAGSCPAGSSPVSCTGQFSNLAALSLGKHTITVAMAADANFASSGGSGTLTVGKGTPAITVAPVSIVQGTATTTLTGQLSWGAATGAAAPTGTLSIQVGAGVIATATCTGSTQPLSCTASYDTSGLLTGSYTIAGSIAGDANYSAASSQTNTLTVTAPPAPTVTGISVNKGLPSGGTVVVVTGTSFTGVLGVKFGTTAAQYTVNSVTQITATSPAGAAGTTVDITVTNSTGISNTAQTSATSSADQFLYLPQNVWLVHVDGSLTELSYTGASQGSAPAAGGSGIAFDAAGNIWSANAGTNKLAEYSKTGAVLNSGFTGGGLNAPAAVAVDGAGQVWVVNGNGSLSAFTNAGVAVSPSGGYTGGGMSAPTGVAIDISGNVWVSNSGNNSVTEVIGGAAPVGTLASGVANATLGTRP